MEGGASTGTMVLLAIIIFGIFVVISYWLFENQIRGMLSGMISDVQGIVDQSFGEGFNTEL